MLFNSLQFLIFFPAMLCVCFLLPARIRQYWLLAASYFFYMCWNAKYALLLLFVTAVTYVGGLFMDAAGGRAKKLCLGACFVLSLGVLFFFKYFGFAMDSLSRLLALVHVQLHAPVFDVLLPVGISFYTFQALGYAVDVYRGQPAERSFARYALFVSFFPQLVAGPIERSRDLLGQLDRIVPPRLTGCGTERFSYCGATF